MNPSCLNVDYWILPLDMLVYVVVVELTYYMPYQLRDFWFSCKCTHIIWTGCWFARYIIVHRWHKLLLFSYWYKLESLALANYNNLMTWLVLRRVLSFFSSFFNAILYCYRYTNMQVQTMPQSQENWRFYMIMWILTVHVTPFKHISAQ